MTADGLTWLMQWYLDQCDDDWEHSYGIDIGNLDNPGWSLKVDLRDTALENHLFTRVEHGVVADDLEQWKENGSWWVAEVKDNRFEGSCGPLDLPELISIFRNWATA